MAGYCVLDEVLIFELSTGMLQPCLYEKQELIIGEMKLARNNLYDGFI
jgi:hypothetical protein